MSRFNIIRNYAAKITDVFVFVVQFGCITHCVLEYGGEFVLCTGPSMEPTINSDDILITENISHRMRWIKRGDIVVARSPSNPRFNICKRVTGLPGDKIHAGIFSDVVPMGHVWLEGDNTSNSSDSRSYGPVPQGLIRGRVICKIWPLSDMKMLTVSKEPSKNYKCR